MKKARLALDLLEQEMELLNAEEMSEFVGGLWLIDGTEIKDFKDLIAYINSHGITSAIADKSFSFSEGSISYVDIRKNSSGQYGAYITTPGRVYNDGNVSPGSITSTSYNKLNTVEVVSTWLNMTEILNMAFTRSTYAWGEGFAMGIKSGDDMSFENFFNKANALVVDYTLGVITGGISSALGLGSGSGYAVGAGGGALGQRLLDPAHAESDKKGNDFMIRALIETSLATSFTQGTGTVSTLVFNGINSGEAVKAAIAVNDLLKAIKDDMALRQYSNNDGSINSDFETSYKARFDSVINDFRKDPNGGSFNDLIRAFGGNPSALQSNSQIMPSIMEYDSSGNLIVNTQVQRNIIHELDENVLEMSIANGNVGALDRATLYFMNTAAQMEKILTSTANETSDNDSAHNLLVKMYDDAFASKTPLEIFLESYDRSMYSVEDGEIFLKVFCQMMPTAGWNGGPTSPYV